MFNNFLHKITTNSLIVDLTFLLLPYSFCWINNERRPFLRLIVIRILIVIHLFRIWVAFLQKAAAVGLDPYHHHMGAAVQKILFN